MSFVCKYCKSKLEDCVQCMNCLDILCVNCAKYCTYCDKYMCEKCLDENLSPYNKDMLICDGCGDMLCKDCPFVRAKKTKVSVDLLKYCVKNDCYKEYSDLMLSCRRFDVNDPTLNKSVPNLDKYIDKLKRENESLKMRLKYVPGSDEFKKIEEHFNELNKTNMSQ